MVAVEQDAAVRRDVVVEPVDPVAARAEVAVEAEAVVADAEAESEMTVAAGAVVTDAEAAGPGGDVTDPAYWARAEFAIKAPVAPALHSKLSCLECAEGTAYGDGTGGYKCFRCGWSS